MSLVGESSAFVDSEDELEDEVTAEALKNAIDVLKRASPPIKRGRGRPPKSASNKRKESSPLSGSDGGSDAVASLLTELLKEVRQQGETQAKMYAEMQRRMNKLEGERASDLEKIRERDKVIEDLEDRVVTLEARDRRNLVLVSSPSIEGMAEDDFGRSMVDLLESKLKIAKDLLDRLSYKKVGKRALITAPCDESRVKLFSAARTHRPRGLYVNESLTRPQSKLFFYVRSFLRAGGLNCRAYTSSGLIYVKKSPESVPVKIRNLSDLQSLF